MEPDVIRMYSSSPPPLDDGAEEEEDEFGDFGGFSGVSTSGAGFGEIESSEFTNSTDFIPPNHFLPVHDYSNNVNSFANFSSVKGSESSDFSRPVGESFNSLISSTSNEITLKSSKIVLDGTTNKEDKQKSVEQTEIVTMPNHLTTNILSRTDVTVLTQEQNIDSYNGDEIAYTEIVTNGFATFDPQNPQGTEDLDSTSDSKALKTISTHSTGLSLDSTPSPAEDLSDFSSFQNADELADHFLTKELEHKVSRDLDEGKTFNTQDNITANSNNELNFVGQVIANASYKNEGVADTEYKQCCSSDHSTVFDEGSSNKGEIAKSDMPMDSDIHSAELPASTSLDTVPHAAHGAETREMCENKYETPHSEKEEFRVSPRVMEGSISNGQEQTTDSDVKADNDFNDFGAVNAEFSSFGQALSSDATEDDFGDFGTLNNAPQSFTKSVQEPAASVVPTKESAQTHEPADEFGDFGGMGTVGDQGFADFFQTAPTEQLASNRSDPEFSDFGTAPLMQANESDGDFGDFDSVSEQKSADNFAAFQEGVTFADFSSAGGNHTTDWNAFGDEQEDDSSWAAFGDEQTAHSNKDETWQPTRTEASSASDGLQTSRTETAQLAPSQRTASHGCAQQLQPAAQASLLIRIEHIFQACFTSVPVLKTEEAITSLKQLLQPGDKPIEAGGTLPHHGELLDVWTELQDIHDAYGLRYQWGGSNSNKKLLCSLGIDTRNILFTGNKKQPVIVPMYAAGLGMLEPTKEPLKPISAAEKIASIGQVLPISPEMSSCTSEQTQESLPPVQFDWSSSGLTNPLDASGGSTLLNLDFFGPVEDSSSSTTTTIPGVDPELYELTTAKLETASTTNRVTDAFARLMSTVEKASTSTRKPKKEENLGKEAAKVIASLPDLSFMHAKVLMFPATLTPSISCQEKAD